MAKVYRVFYDRQVGGVGSVIVKALNEAQAIGNARHLVYTGVNFREPVEVDPGVYVKPRKQGFQGSQRV
jgi:hypothetical protein